MLSFIQRKIHELLGDKKFSEILVGSAWALGARILAAGLGLIASIIIARAYGADVMGVVAVVNSFMLLATIFTVLGTNSSILRVIPEHLVKHSATSAFKVYRKTQSIVLGASLIVATMLFLSADLIAEKVFAKPDLSFYFVLSSLCVVFKSMMLLNTQAVRGLRLIRAFAIMQFLPQGFNVILLILVGLLWLSKDGPVYALLGGFTLTGIVGCVIMEYAFKKRIQPQDHVEPMRAWHLLSISLPMLMSQTMTFVSGQTGVIFLGIFKTEAEVGYYAAAVKMATLTTFMLTAINSMAAPRFSELFNAGKMEDLFHVARKSTKLIFWTTAPVLILLVLLGKQILWMLFGKEFTVAYLTLVFLTAGQFINSISGSTGAFMNMTGHQNKLSKIMLAAAAINVAMNLLLIPGLGINGSAIAGMISVGFWNICTLLYIKSKYGRTIGYFGQDIVFRK